MSRSLELRCSFMHVRSVASGPTRPYSRIPDGFFTLFFIFIVWLESVCSNMSNPDRWISRILDLPVFDSQFAQVVKNTPLSSLAFVVALGASSSAEFVERVLGLARSLDGGVAQVFEGRELMLEQFWTLAIAVEKSYFESTAVQLGFGQCETVPTPSPDPTAPLRKRAANASLSNKSLAPPKKSKGGSKDPSAASSTSTPLFDKERSEKKKWAARLEEIGLRAGEHAKLFMESHLGLHLSAGEKTQLRNLVLVSGAHRTMAGHIKTYERLERWFSAVDVPLYPLSIDKLLKYALFLNDRECGPSVLPTFRAAVKWVCARLAIDEPQFEDHRFLALQASVLSARAKTLKEAVPLPIEVVGVLEQAVVSDDRPKVTRIFIWWILCMVFASLRFDDAVHVRPSELIMQEEGLFGVAWQTKVERKRVGTRFVVPKIGFVASEWLEVGWDLFRDSLRGERDYWIPDMATDSEFKNEPPQFARVLQWFKYLCRHVVDRAHHLGKPVQVECALKVNKLTMHSCRVTLLDAAVHAGRTTEEIGLQANWKDPGPLVLKYTRNRSAVPALMVKQLVKDLVQAQHPVVEDQDTLLMDAPDGELSAVEYFIKKPSAGSSYEYKFHCTARGNEEFTACNKFALTDCSSVGDVLPDPSVLRKACARARPEVASFHSSAPAAP